MAMDLTSIKRRLRLEDGVTGYEVGALVREIATRDYGSIRALSRAWGISVPYLAEVANGTRTPGPKVLKQLGLYRRVITTYHARPAEKRP